MAKYRYKENYKYTHPSKAEGGKSGNHKTGNILRLNRKGVAFLGGITFLAGSAVGIFANNQVQEVRDDYKLQKQLTSKDALDKYNLGEVDPRKATIVIATEAGTPYETAKALNPDADPRPLSRQIESQDGRNGYEGVQPGEQFVVERDELPKPTPSTHNADRS